LAALVFDDAVNGTTSENKMTISSALFMAKLLVVADSILSAAMLSHRRDIAQPRGVLFAKPLAL
jgi:hypothetical protein